MKKPLGCLSPGGLIAGLLTVGVVLGVMLLWGGRLFSPGALNAQAGAASLGGVQSHAEIGGRCAACHTAPWGSATMSDRCLACHDDLALQLQDPSSLHGALKVSSDHLACYDCHPEHRGATAQLTFVDPNTFPHDATGYSLQGHKKTASGTRFTCADCHAESLAQFDVAVCASCHRELNAAFMQDHVAAFGLGCLACHDGVDTYGSRFDHNLVAFPLKGKHAPLLCANCHTGARSIADLQATPQDCYACHQKDDAHDGQFGQDCAGCHTPADWQQATFDHDKTPFPLVGKHRDVACAGCHVNNDFKGTPQDCFSCHQKDDAHDGQFGQDCVQCHTPVDWKQATFDHDKTPFPLVGKHRDVACAQCHVNNVFKGTPQDCFSCHQKDDAHNGQFGQDCAQCHTPADWQQATFDHDKTPFPLVGKHRDVACAQCHVDNVFKGTPQDCFSCHQKDDAHNGQFGQDCAQCHTPVDWKQATFDHAQTGFPLTGAHLQVECTQCHVNNVFKGTPTQCSSCHDEPAYHAGLFGTDCVSCHTTDAWSPARFNGPHTFPINHGERGPSSCQTCHPDNLQTYTCYGCHEHQQAEIVARHLAEGITDVQDCVRCHPTGREEEGGD
jgi:hypothetical protein